MKSIFSNMNNRLKKTMIISLISIVVIFLLVIIISAIFFRNKEYSYTKFENKMKNAAIDYFKEKEKLPTIDGGETSVKLNTLVETGYLKPLEKYGDKFTECAGEVYASYVDGEYFYTGHLTCLDYKTNTLLRHILDNEDVIQDHNAGDSGLYQYDKQYIYRGEHVNNYIKISGQLWRILRINEDGTLRLLQTEPVTESLWDNRYNVSTGEYSGYNDFEKSRLDDTLTMIEDGNYGDVFKDADKKYIVKKPLCLDSKNENSFDISGNIACNTVSERKHLYSLPDISEYFIASADLNCNSFNNPSCSNYNYMNYYGSYWSMNKSSDNNYQAYYISGGARIEDVNRDEEVRLVVTLSKHVMYADGDGSMNNPYTIQKIK